MFFSTIARRVYTEQVLQKQKSRSKALSFVQTVSAFSFLFFLASCGNEVSIAEAEYSTSDSLALYTAVVAGQVQIVEPVIDEEVVVLQKEGITLTEIKPQKQSDAAIQLTTKKFSIGKNQLSFAVRDVQDYSIAYLANNYALAQFKSELVEVEFLNGNNVFLAFLTDKNNIGIKTNKASVLKSAVLGGVESLFDMDQPHLFYYLPQAETQEPILDFYLANTSITQNGNKVKVLINEVEFSINKWAAYQISGLTTSENSVRIQLLDKNNQLIEGPFNDSGERKFKVLKKE
jgi:hypothetical protein